MARKKVKLAWIYNDAARRATFKKRKKGLMKKVSELSTLCGVEAIAIVLSPYDPQPKVWPSVYDVQRTLLRFENMTELDQGKRMLNQEGYFRNKIDKLSEQLKRAINEANELMVEDRMGQFLSGRRDTIDDVCIMDLNEMSRKIHATINMLNERVEVLQGWGSSMGLQQPLNANAYDWLTGNKEPHSEKRAARDALQGQQWFVEVTNRQQQHMAGGGPAMGASYSGNGSTWFDAFHPANVNGLSNHTGW